MHMPPIKAVALDLEGTLISNAMSQFPRKGLFQFLERCGLHLPRVVLYTAVGEPRAREIVQGLVDDGLAPDWFASIEYISWDGPHKDLHLIPMCLAQDALLVDDNPDYVHPEQSTQWVPIKEFASPYHPDDELQRIWEVLQRLVLQSKKG